MIGSPYGGEVLAATRTVEALHAEAEVLRAELRALQHELAMARQSPADDRNAQLLEANGRLLIAAQEARMFADAVQSDFDTLMQTSQRDALTDTPNRALMLDRLESAISMAQRRGSRVAIMFLDIDHFKKINDTLGHAAGDAVLQLVSRRLESAVRDSDAVSRHSGDEFLVLLAEISQVSDAALIAQKMLRDIAHESVIAGTVLDLSVSLGIAVYPDDGHEAASLIGMADAAMYHSKRRGGGQYTFYSPASQSES